MTLIIICSAGAVETVNRLLQGPPFNATGQNVSVPAVIKTAKETDATQFYSCNWECFSDEHFAELKKRAKGVPGLYVYDGKKEKGFDTLLKRLNIKRKDNG